MHYTSASRNEVFNTQHKKLRNIYLEVATTRKASMKNIEIILAIRELQKMTSNTETPDIIKVLKDARNLLIKIYAEDNKQELQNILIAVESMSNR